MPKRKKAPTKPTATVRMLYTAQPITMAVTNEEVRNEWKTLLLGVRNALYLLGVTGEDVTRINGTPSTPITVDRLVEILADTADKAKGDLLAAKRDLKIAKQDHDDLTAEAQKNRKTLDEWGKQYGKLPTETMRDYVLGVLEQHLVGIQNAEDEHHIGGGVKDYYARRREECVTAMRVVAGVPTQASPSAMVQAVLGMMPHRPTVGTSTNAATIVAGRADQ